MKQDKKIVLEKIKELQAQQEALSHQIFLDNRESQEEEMEVRQELLAQQGMLESQIQGLKDSLKVETTNKLLGKQIKVKINGNLRELTIVSTIEANPALGQITIDSPIAQAIQGKKSGEKVSIATPAGEQILEIISL